MTIVKAIIGGIIVTGVMFAGLAQCSPVRADTLRIQILPGPSGFQAPRQDYRPETPPTRLAPASRVLALPIGTEAPAGPCGALFEVVSGADAGRGCYGRR